MKVIFGVLTVGILLSLSGCVQEEVFYGKKDNTPYKVKECQRTLYKGKELIDSKRIDKIVVYKSKRLLQMYKDDVVVKSSKVSLGKNGDKGHKVEAGDYRTPTGVYKIVRKKCDTRLYKSLMISYPDAEDRARSRKKGVQPGGYITIHGQPKWNASGKGDKFTLSHDWTEGCIAVPNKIMDRLWEAVATGIPIRLYP